MTPGYINKHRQLLNCMGDKNNGKSVISGNIVFYMIFEHMLDIYVDSSIARGMQKGHHSSGRAKITKIFY